MKSASEYGPIGKFFCSVHKKPIFIYVTQKLPSTPTVTVPLLDSSTPIDKTWNTAPHKHRNAKCQNSKNQKNPSTQPWQIKMKFTRRDAAQAKRKKKKDRRKLNEGKFQIFKNFRSKPPNQAETRSTDSATVTGPPIHFFVPPSPATTSLSHIYSFMLCFCSGSTSKDTKILPIFKKLFKVDVKFNPPPPSPTHSHVKAPFFQNRICLWT